MKRREFIMLLGGAAVSWPLAARAQQPALPVVEYLTFGPKDSASGGLLALRQGLREAGYVEGRNVITGNSWADGQYDRLRELAADLVRRQVSLIYTTGVPATAAAKAASATIPIVFQMGQDPVAFGLVASLNRPGANLTGVATFGGGLVAKHLELLHELIPTETVVALLVNPANPSSGAVVSELEPAARKLGLELHVVQASAERDFEPAFATLHQLGAGGLVISNEGQFIGRSEELAALALRHRVPAIHMTPAFSAAGGLMSYGGSATEVNRLVARYIVRILKGEKPADLPVQQVTRIELVINLKTAKALGLTVPFNLLANADEVIE
jgi:putative tryptophan/tyrosine transport system substrate-binding protein